MKIAVIGANGRLGSRIIDQALSRNWLVTGFIIDDKIGDPRVHWGKKSLFDLTTEDIHDQDVVISAFGGGFHADPLINRQAYNKYTSLIKDTGKRFIMIAGAGSLYTDRTHTKHEYEMPGYNPVLAKISENIHEGIEDLKKSNVSGWTAVCPSRKFDPNGTLTKNYKISDCEEIVFNDDGNSYVTYDDLAMAMLDIAETGKYKNEVITVLSTHGE
jgi:Putative NADH-flavin reductase